MLDAKLAPVYPGCHTQYGLMAARCTKDTCNSHPAEQLSLSNTSLQWITTQTCVGCEGLVGSSGDQLPHSEPCLAESTQMGNTQVYLQGSMARRSAVNINAVPQSFLRPHFSIFLYQQKRLRVNIIHKFLETCF